MREVGVGTDVSEDDEHEAKTLLHGSALVISRSVDIRIRRRHKSMMYLQVHDVVNATRYHSCQFLHCNTMNN